MIIISLGISVLMRRSFDGVWGHCGWKGNAIGRWLRGFWAFGGEGGFGNVREGRVLDVLGERAVMGEVEEDSGVCVSCSEGYGTF